MFDRHFFTSKLGIAALVSVAMMVTFNVYAISMQLTVSEPVADAAGPPVGMPLLVLA